ncbi:hypothetical protein ACM66B_005480 [Microbotryomycetes sp. NB124-2]
MCSSAAGASDQSLPAEHAAEPAAISPLSTRAAPAPGGRAEYLHLVSHTSDSGDTSSSSRIASIYDVSARDGPARSDLDSTASADWPSWLDSYARGHWKPDVPPQPPLAISTVLEQADSTGQSSDAVRPNLEALADSLPGSQESGFSTRYSASPGSPSSPPATAFTIYPDSVSSPSGGSVSSSRASEGDHVLAFFRKHRYLPGPKGAYEEERLRTMRKFDLQDPTRRASINRICRMAKNRFRSNTIIITLVHRDHSVLAAEAGFDNGPNEASNDTNVRVLPQLNTSLCTHGMLRLKKPTGPQDTFVVPDLTKDWRFAHNPQSPLEGGSLAFYAAAPIHLPTAKSSGATDVPDTLPVGSICVLGDKAQSPEAFTADDRTFLIDCAEMCAREFDLGREQRRRRVEQQQSDFLGQLVQEVLVTPLSSQISHVAPSTEAVKENHGAQSTSILNDSFSSSTSALIKLTGAHGAAIFDLRSYRSPLRRPGSRNGLGSRSAAMPAQATPLMSSVADAFQKGTAEGETLFRAPNAKGRIYLMAGKGDVQWDEVVRDQEQLGMAVSESLSHFYDNNRCQFDAGTAASPLGAVLPAFVNATCIVPVFDNHVPQLLVVLTSSDRLFQFDESDLKFATVAGSVLASALLRERALAVDRAKLAFVSQISHELRAPLHSVTSQLELIREFSAPHELRKLAPMLDVCDVCLESLRDVLDDTLDFAKQTAAPVVAPKLFRVDLALLAEDVIKATWVRKRRSDIVANDVSNETASKTSMNAPGVDVVLEVEQREQGWLAWVDTGGLKRVLLNLLGNALKFTEKGHVKLSLRSKRPDDSPTVLVRRQDHEVIFLEIEDTGCGMDESFLREGKLFTPFVQADPFANGAGLGMSITQQIVNRMGGRIDVVSSLGQGTSVRVILPLEFGAPSTPSSPVTPRAMRGSTRDLDMSTPRAEDSASPQVPLSSSSSTRRSSRRVISDELMALFNPSSTLMSTPLDEKASFDFGQAVDAAHTALGSSSRQALLRVPSRKRKVTREPSVMDDRASPGGIADDVAKLSLAGALQALSPRQTATQLSSSPPLAMSLDRVAGPSETAKQAAQTRSEVEPTLPKVNVLFADDNSVARSILQKLFGGKGIPYTAAANGQEAVDAYKNSNTPFHLFVVDVQMPVKDGIEASHDIREYEAKMGLPRCRIMALTGLNNEADMQKAGVLGEAGAGPVDIWVTKGGKSMRTIMNEVANIQAELAAATPGNVSAVGGPTLASTDEKVGNGHAVGNGNGKYEKPAGLICESGHVFNFAVETNEQDIGGAGGAKQVTLRAQRLKRQQPKQAKQRSYGHSSSHFHGQRSIYLVWQAMQWVLRRQVDQLTKPKAQGGHFEWPRELEHITRDLWAMYMASVGVRDAPKDFVNGQEPATSYSGVRQGMGMSRPHKKSRKRRRENDDQDQPEQDEDDDADGQLEPGEDRSRHSSDGEDTESDSNPDADHEDNDEETDAVEDAAVAAAPDEAGDREPAHSYDLPDDLPKPRTAPWLMDDPRAKPRMDALLVILYLACVTLRLPVFLRDIAHLAETHQILYLNASHHLPAVMWTHLDLSAQRTLDIRDVKQVQLTGDHTLMSFTRLVVKMYKEDWGVLFPEPNLPPIAWRLCKSLACPPPFYVYLKRLASLIPNFGLTIQPAVRTRAKNLDSMFVEPAEQVLVAGLVLVARLVWNLDAGGDGKPMTKSLGNVPDADTWLEAIAKVRQLQDSSDISALWSKETVDMSAADVDAYLDFFEQRIVPTASVPNRMRDIDRFFPAPFDTATNVPGRDKQMQDAAAEIDKILSTLYARVCDSIDSNAASTTEPRERPHFHYVPSHSATLPHRLQTLYDHAARLVGTTTREIESTVSKLEKKLNQPMSMSEKKSWTEVQDGDGVDYRHETLYVISESKTGKMKSVPVSVDAVARGLVRLASDDEDVDDSSDDEGFQDNEEGVRERTNGSPAAHSSRMTRHGINKMLAKRNAVKREIEAENERLWREELERRQRLREIGFELSEARRARKRKSEEVFRDEESETGQAGEDGDGVEGAGARAAAEQLGNVRASSHKSVKRGAKTKQPRTTPRSQTESKSAATTSAKSRKRHKKPGPVPSHVKSKEFVSDSDDD